MKPGAHTRPRYWVAALILALALIEPLTHLWLLHGIREPLAHSGFHIGDTPFFLTAMNIFQNGLFSPYAPCQSEAGAASISYFALPHHWMYGALGFTAHHLGISHFLFLGLMNGLGFAFFLWMTWRFLRYLLPERAPCAFLIFTVGGGLGGLLYAAAWISASTGRILWPWLHRYVRYELIEGPFINPVLIAPRLYYTLPLGLGMLALTLVLRTRKQRPQQGRASWTTLALFFFLTLLNARLGPLFFFVLLCLLYVDSGAFFKRLSFALSVALPMLVSVVVVAKLFSLNPTGQENVALLLRRSAWFGSVLSVGCWRFLPALPLALYSSRGLPLIGRCAALAALGYLSAFAGLYFAHQAYYGNLISGGDTAAAIAISDWALLGLLPGLAIALGRRPDQAAPAPLSAAALWLLGLLSVSIAAFGSGSFMRLMPERCLVLTGPPLALLAAEGLHRLGQTTRGRWLSASLTTLILGSGLLSILIAIACLQGPCGFDPRDPDAPFPWTHSEVIPAADARLIQRIPEGAVLAPASVPPLYGDIIVTLNPKTRTLFGQCSLEFGGVNMAEMGRAVQAFFGPETPPVQRKDFVEAYCVDYVYCPTPRPGDSPDAIRTIFHATPWMQQIDQEGEAILFKVNREGGA